MPERRQFRGREVKRARKIIVNGQPVIRITFSGRKGQPGPQVDVTLQEYQSDLKRSFTSSSG